jgi:hypothetical protein
MILYLTIKHGHVVGESPGMHGGYITRVIRSVASLRDLQRSLKDTRPDYQGTYCSSALDFPEEAGANHHAIALCEAIRNAP